MKERTAIEWNSHLVPATTSVRSSAQKPTKTRASFYITHSRAIPRHQWILFSDRQATGKSQYHSIVHGQSERNERQSPLPSCCKKSQLVGVQEDSILYKYLKPLKVYQWVQVPWRRNSEELDQKRNGRGGRKGKRVIPSWVKIFVLYWRHNTQVRAHTCTQKLNQERGPANEEQWQQRRRRAKIQLLFHPVLSTLVSRSRGVKQPPHTTKLLLRCFVLIRTDWCRKKQNRWRGTEEIEAQFSAVDFSVIECPRNCAMLVRWLSLAGLIILSVANAGTAAGQSSGDVFTSSFLVRFKRNVDTEYAHEIANKYGYDNLGTVGGYVVVIIVVYRWTQG